MKKKNLKLLSAALVCTGMLTCFTGCGEKEKDPFTVYNEASKKTSELKSLEAAVDMNLNMDVQGISMEIPMTMDMKLENMNTQDMILDMKMSMEVMGQSMDMNSYYTDGYYYLDSEGSQIKYAMDLEDIKEQISVASVQTDLKKEDFKEITLEDKDDVQTLTYTIDGKSMSETANSALGSLSGMLGDTDMNMEMQDVKGTATVNKDGYISAMQMELPLSLSVEGQDMTLNIDMDITYNNPGSEVKVELPDLSSYEEVDMNALSGADSTSDNTDSSSSENDTSDLSEDEESDN